MEMSQDEHHQINTGNPGAVVESIVHGHGDAIFKSEVPAVDAGITDACIFTSPVIGSLTDLLKCPTASENSNVIPEEGIKECAITNGNVISVSCISPFPLTVSEADPNCSTIKKGIGLNVASIDNKEEITVHHDDGDLIAHKAIDGNVSASPDTAAKIVLSRERKKSKYLCYPFVNLDKGSKVLHFSPESEIDDSEILGNDDSSSLIKCSKRKRESRKPLTSSINIETLTASSSELLMQLHVVAIDHLSPYYDSAFDPAQILFKRFRESVFPGLPNSEVLGVANIQYEEDADFHVQEGKPNKKPGRRMKKEKPPSDLNDANVNAATDSPLPADLSNKMKSTRKRKKNEVTATPPSGPNNGDPTEENQQPRRRGRPKGVKGTPPGISYINGNSVKPISLEVCLQDAGPYPIPNSAPSADIQTPEKTSAEVTIDQMKQSLLFMTAMLEKSATTISPETRASLEIEIKNLLEKVNPVVSSSS